jgi:hypothetical protein
MGKQLVSFITCGCESSASFFWFSGFRGEDLNVKVYDGRRMPKAHMAFGQVS